jgi:hypothetical protein
MRKSMLTLTLAALAAFTLLIPVAGQAVDPPVGDDVLGLYTAPDFSGAIAANVDAAQFSTVEAYLTITGLTAPSNSVKGFELTITTVNGSQITNTAYPTAAIDVDGAPNLYLVGFASPVFATDGVVNIATVSILLIPTEEEVLLEPYSFPAIPDEISYIDGADLGLKIELTPSSGTFVDPCFGINTGPIGVSTQETTWSQVKDIFR